MFSFIPVAYCSTTVKKHFNPDAASDFYSRVCNRNISSSGSKQQEIFNFAQENCFLCCYELSTRGRCWCLSVQRMSLLQAGNSLRLWIQTNRQNWKITAGDILTAAHTRTRLNDVGGNFVLPTATRCEPRGRCYLLSPLMGLRVEPEQV